MFTGIIQDVGKIVHLRREPDQMRMHVGTSLDFSGWRIGDSVAVDGCCLTVTDFPETNVFAATLSPETLKRTRFAEAATGWKVNLEPALRVGDALGGHMVSGHVDGTAMVLKVRQCGEHRMVSFRAPEHLARYIVVKGSVSLNGVSLTVNEVDGPSFSVNLIPHTLVHTNLDELEAGDRVNIETDLFARYVERLMQYNDDPEFSKK